METVIDDDDDDSGSNIDVEYRRMWLTTPMGDIVFCNAA